MIDKKDYLEILKSITRDDVEKAFENLFQNNSINYKSRDTGTENSIIYKNSRFALIRIFEQICIDKFDKYDMSKSNQNNVNYLDISNVFKNLGYEILPSIDSKECLKFLKEEYKKYLDEKYPQGYDQTYFSDPFYLSRDKNQDKCKDDGIYFWKLFENEQNLNKYFEFLKKEYPNPNTHNAFKSKTNILNRFFVEKYGDYFNWLKSFDISSHSIEEYIKKYSLFKKTKDYDEQYKFDYAQKNKGIFNELSNLESKIKSLGNPNFNSYFIGRCSGLKHLMENHLEDLNKALTILFSDEDLETRIISFKNILNDKLINDSNWHNNKTLVEIQTASYFLFTNDYEKNLLFTKMKPYEKFAKKFNLQNLLNYASEEERYITWQKYCETELLPIMDKVLNKRHSLLDAQDFIWFIGNNTEVDREEKTQEDKNMAVNIPLNQILYGPPGTGKTYNTVVEALKIADKDFYNENKDNYTELHRKFNELKQAGQIEFVTFHQSYSYEEFVEGIKPDVTAEDLKYLQKDGAFKDICNKARKKEFSNFDETYNAFLEEIIEYEDENSKPFTLRTLKNKTFGVRVNSNKNLTLLMGKELKAWGTLTKHNLENISDWKYYANPIYTYLKEKYNLNTQNNEELKNYVLVIDEINRGNISKIFGELITLIEDDKRENLTVKLPYSQEEFTVPKNLYILGTMNTSDRSIAAVDIALRRRFKFKEMMPTSDIKGFREDFKERFEILNRRISFLLDRDHQIGHSYFLNNSDSLENIWYDNIMPLLNEYFYGDWEKLQNILGVAENENSDKTHKYNSFIKKISKSSLKLKGDTSCLDDYYYDFVPQENIDFEKAMKNAFGEISNEETNADN